MSTETTVTTQTLDCPVLVHFSDETCVTAAPVELETISVLRSQEDRSDVYRTLVATIGGERYTLGPNSRTDYQIRTSKRCGVDGWQTEGSVLVQLSVNRSLGSIMRNPAAGLGLVVVRLPNYLGINK